MTLKKLVFLLAGAVFLSGNAVAKIINVPGDYPKIADALGNADAGDTIKVARGVYNENITLALYRVSYPQQISWYRVSAYPRYP